MGFRFRVYFLLYIVKGSKAKESIIDLQNEYSEKTDAD